MPRGADVPYAVEDNKIYVRNEAETVQAVRDEIVELVGRAQERVDGRMPVIAGSGRLMDELKGFAATLGVMMFREGLNWQYLVGFALAAAGIFLVATR